MAKRRSTLYLFLDSSVLFTAVNSSFGGSAKLFTLPDVKLHVFRVVLHEVEKNVRKKLGEIYLERFFRLIDQSTVLNIQSSENEIVKAGKVIMAKDSAILAEFKRSICTHLITLDKRDFLQDTVFKFVAPKKIWTPKMFFENN